MYLSANKPEFIKKNKWIIDQKLTISIKTVLTFKNIIYIHACLYSKKPGSIFDYTLYTENNICTKEIIKMIEEKYQKTGIELFYAKEKIPSIQIMV